MLRDSAKAVIVTVLVALLISPAAFAKMFEGPAPTSYDEAPMLKAQVDAGKLPPVDERLPKHPYVVDTNESIGRYGGTMQLMTRYTNVPVGVTFVGGYVQLMKSNPQGNDVVMDLAESVEASDDMRVFTFKLREGLKWSDGVPFTTEDIMFWYNDIFLNKELTPAISPTYKSGGEPMKVKALGPYRFQIIFKEPKPYFFTVPVIRLNQSHRFFSPKHWLKQFHPNYTSKEELAKKVKEAGYDYWYELFDAMNEGYNEATSVPNAPTLGPWVTKEFTSSRHVFERNPYFWKVDEEGNQLPYVDRVVSKVVSDVEVAQGKIISGEIDFNGFMTKLVDYPMYRQYENDGGYKTALWESGMTTETAYIFNLNNSDPELASVFQDVRFRRAMSLAINRQEIADSLYFGKAKPIQETVFHSSKFYKPEYAQSYVDFDPERAKSLLDEMGLVDKNGDGWRELPNGKPMHLLLEFTSSENPLRRDNANLVAEYWRGVGVRIDAKELASELFATRRDNNEIQVTLNDGWAGQDMWFPQSAAWYTNYGADNGWPVWTEAWDSGQEADGSGPTFQKVKQLREWFEEMTSSPDAGHRAELAQKILESQAENLWTIGTVGGAPHAVIFDKNLHNVPEDGVWIGCTQWTMSRDPEQFYFDADEGTAGNK